jgi:hypothetical protein
MRSPYRLGTIESDTFENNPILSFKEPELVHSRIINVQSEQIMQFIKLID